MAQGPSDTILVAIWFTLRIRESKVRNPDPPDRWRFVLSECSLVNNVELLFCCPVSVEVLGQLTVQLTQQKSTIKQDISR